MPLPREPPALTGPLAPMLTALGPNASMPREVPVTVAAAIVSVPAVDPALTNIPFPPEAVTAPETATLTAPEPLDLTSTP